MCKPLLVVVVPVLLAAFVQIVAAQDLKFKINTPYVPLCLVEPVCSLIQYG